MSERKTGPQEKTERGRRLYRPQRPVGLARALMKAGYGTRKQADSYVSEGRVEVNDEVVTDPGAMVGPDCTISLDGKPLVHQPARYFLFHKPVGVVCTPGERQGRRLVGSYLPRDVPGLAVVGRLDYRTSGLMLATNDRTWSRLLTGNPLLEQEYRIRLAGRLASDQLEVLTAGVMLPKLGLFKPLQVNALEGNTTHTDLAIVLGEGKARHIRRMFGALHHKVVSLQRVRVGDVKLGDLKAGSFRQMTGKEVEHLRGMGMRGRSF